MDAGKQILQDEKRQSKSKDVKIIFIDGAFQHFNVLGEENEIKHLGVIMEKERHKNDFCTCPSFYFGQSDEYKKANPVAFQCKHLHAARQIRYEGYPQ